MVDAGRVIAIFGPTGVGKTSVAVEVAERLGVSVISCDSMQLYQGFPVLTNQPRLQETRGVKHELVAVADSQEEWTAVEYGRRAQEAIDRSRAETGWALLVGGTGLYMRAALAPLSAPRAHDPQLRAELTRRGEEEGVDKLYRELEELDANAARTVEQKNLRRVVRALEVVTLQGPASRSPAPAESPPPRHAPRAAGSSAPPSAQRSHLTPPAPDTACPPLLPRPAGLVPPLAADHGPAVRRAEPARPAYRVRYLRPRAPSRSPLYFYLWPPAPSGRTPQPSTPLENRQLRPVHALRRGSPGAWVG